MGDYLIKRLYDNGIRYIFGIPGDYVLTFYRQLENSEIKIIIPAMNRGQDLLQMHTPGCGGLVLYALLMRSAA